MAEAPQTRYARQGGTHIAYQVVGDGDRDILVFPSGQYPIDLIWEDDACRAFLERLASFSRLILFDLRGWGASDRIGPETEGLLERWSEDIITVLDAVGSERVTLLGVSEAGPAAIVFAASHPQRSSALVLVNTCARFARADDYPAGLPEDRVIPTVTASWNGGGAAGTWKCWHRAASAIPSSPADGVCGNG